MEYDAVVLLSFGGPEGPDDVLPFLRNVTRGRGVPEHRLAEVAEHYQHFGGVSPINDQCRALLAALRTELDAAGIGTPLYWGNRNWRPMLADTVAAMRDAGVRRALAFVTSAYGSYSGCRQYLEDIAAARRAVGPGAPEIDKIRQFHDHPGLIATVVDAVRAARATLPADGTTRLVFTAHSIPVRAAEASGPEGGRYVAQLRETAGLVAAAVGAGFGGGDKPVGGGESPVGGGDNSVGGGDKPVGGGRLGWDLVWQSRSGPPRVPWLEPDVNEHLEKLAGAGVTQVVVCPVGFLSDHLEVLWDLDTEAAATARRLGLGYARAATPGTDPRFVAMIRELIQERLEPHRRRRALGTIPTWDHCEPGCCPAVAPGVGPGAPPGPDPGARPRSPRSGPLAAG